MNLKHLRKRIISKSNFYYDIIDKKLSVYCECLGFISCQQSYPVYKTDKIEITDDIKFHLVSLLINENDFLSKLQQIENRIKNLNELV